MNKGFTSESEARKRAKADMPTKHVVIIESRGEFYVEPAGDGGLIRSWEREVYTGIGAKALPKSWHDCWRCGAFIDNSKHESACRRCGAEVGVAPVGVGL